MRVFRVIEKSEEQIEKVLCDLCGEEIEEIYIKNNEYLHIQKRWGYHSPWDGEIHELDICPHCYGKLLEKRQERNIV